MVATKLLCPRPLQSLNALSALLAMSIDEIRALATTAGSHYDPFDIRHDPGKKWRHVDRPDSTLKAVQKRINRFILSGVVLPETVHGGVRGRSIVTNAAAHLRKPQLITFDLKNCFHRTKSKAIYGVFVGTVETSAEIAGLLTKLTTYQYHLPLGAPTSPTLANLALLPLHNALQDWLRPKDSLAPSMSTTSRSLVRTHSAMLTA